MAIGSSSEKGSIPLEKDYSTLQGGISNTSKHFVGQDTETPPIDGFTVTFIEEDFWSEVFWSTAKCVSSSFDVFSETEIGKFEISISGDQKIFWFQIPEEIV